MRGAERFIVSKIKIDLPTRETPGYWRRVRRSAALQERMRAGMSVELCDELIEFLLPFVSVPEDREQAREVLLDANQNDFEKMMKAFTGGGNETTAPPQSTTPSENTTSPE
jgi:hypothetical protein